MPDSFEDCVFDELRKQYPALKDEFIKLHQSELMELLQFGKSKTSSVEERATSIPDKLPEELFNGMSLTDEPESMEPATHAGDTKLLNCLELLNLVTSKVLSGEVASLCIQSIRRDGGMEMVFTMPCNVYAFLGFMHNAINKHVQVDFRDPRDQV